MKLPFKTLAINSDESFVTSLGRVYSQLPPEIF